VERAKRSVLSEFAVPAAAVGVGLVLGAVLMLLTGASPLRGYGALLQGSFGSPVNVSETIVYITPLIFTGLSMAVAFRCGLFNIGAEGQFIVGMVAAAVAGCSIRGLPWILHMPISVLAGAAAGALWASVPGFLKARFGVHEVVNTIMMNYIALYLSHYLVNGPIKDPAVTSPYSREVLASARLIRFMGEGGAFRVNMGTLIAIGAAFLVYYILWKTTVGYEIRAVGHNPDAARYAGISVAKNIITAMAISGALAGLAGSVQVLGIQYRFLDLFAFEGYGFDGIAVSLVGKNHPFGILASASLFGVLARGAQTMQGMARVPKETVGIIQAAVIFFVAAEGLIEGWLPGRRLLGSILPRKEGKSDGARSRNA
jgi:simple sugar transport system permease protein